jgi:hypothetical protein
MEGPFLVKSLWIKLWNCAKEGHVALRLCNTKYFDSMSTYKTFYKFIVRCLRCSSVALAIVLQTKIVDWLRAQHEQRAADWFEEYWTGERGHCTLAHAGVGDHGPVCAHSCPIDSSLPDQQEQGECLVLETRHQVKMQDLECHDDFP